MRIHVLSDVHLEFGDIDPPLVDADVVVAAGDMHIGIGAFDWLAALDKPVIYVAGNHELYQGDFYQTVGTLRQVYAGTNIHFLERDRLDIGNTSFLGCTLWTSLGGFEPDCVEYARECMNDFSYISLSDRNLEPEDIARYNAESPEWLTEALTASEDRQQVVVTHHAPSMKSWGFDTSGFRRYLYCNELDDFIRSRHIALWIHGHVHCHSDYSILDTRVVCNPRGYSPHKLVDTFEINKVVEI